MQNASSLDSLFPLFYILIIVVIQIRLLLLEHPLGKCERQYSKNNKQSADKC